MLENVFIQSDMTNEFLDLKNLAGVYFGQIKEKFRALLQKALIIKKISFYKKCCYEKQRFLLQKRIFKGDIFRVESLVKIV